MDGGTDNCPSSIGEIKRVVVKCQSPPWVLSGLITLWAIHIFSPSWHNALQSDAPQASSLTHSHVYWLFQSLHCWLFQFNARADSEQEGLGSQRLLFFSFMRFHSGLGLRFTSACSRWISRALSLHNFLIIPKLIEPCFLFALAMMLLLHNGRTLRTINGLQRLFFSMNLWHTNMWNLQRSTPTPWCCDVFNLYWS